MYDLYRLRWFTIKQTIHPVAIPILSFRHTQQLKSPSDKQSKVCTSINYGYIQNFGKRLQRHEKEEINYTNQRILFPLIFYSALTINTKLGK